MKYELSSYINDGATVVSCGGGGGGAVVDIHKLVQNQHQHNPRDNAL
jgi:hypothetical protein